MPQTPDWKRLLETGMEFTEMRRSRARQIAADLAAQGQLARDQVSATVDELIEASRERSEKFRDVVRAEVQRQLGALGLATKADLAALERRLANRSQSGTAKQAAKTRATKKTTAKKTAKRSPAKKPTTKKRTTKKSGATKSAARANARTARRTTKKTAKKTS
jgi:polyhydroxyalkanoate synthesis regulator phasin